MIDTTFKFQTNFNDLENNLPKKFVLERIGNAFAGKGFTLQFVEFEIVNPIEDIELIQLFANLGEVLTIAPSKFTILNDNYCINITSSNRDGYKPLISTIYTSNVDDYKTVRDKFKALIEPIRKKIFSVKIRWYYTTKEGSDYVSMMETIEDIVHQESYPFIPNIDQYVDDYIKSNEQVLILIGPPGTGKTRFLRYFLKKLHDHVNPMTTTKDWEDIPTIDEDKQITVSYTTDKNVIESDHIFIDLFSDRVNCLILEDIDFNLRARKEGNTAMYKLLAASDGLITNSNRKIIVSTNLENENRIDSAFIRPGRCFDILKFRPLDLEESNLLLGKWGITKELTKDGYTLGELYRIKNTIK
jgi:hypothetical protein